MKLRSEGLTWQEIDGELVILDLKNSVYLTTNAAGAVIAKLLTEGAGQSMSSAEHWSPNLGSRTTSHATIQRLSSNSSRTSSCSTSQ